MLPQTFRPIEKHIVRGEKDICPAAFRTSDMQRIKRWEAELLEMSGAGGFRRTHLNRLMRQTEFGHYLIALFHPRIIAHFDFQNCA